MKINEVTIEYKELRSSGFPTFSNKTYGITYSAKLDDTDDADDIKRRLLAKAIKEVRLLHGDKIDDRQLEFNLISTDKIPF